MATKKRITITVIRGKDGLYVAGDGIWAYGTGRTFRSALRDYADTVMHFMQSNDGQKLGPGLQEQQDRYLAVIKR